MAFGVKRAELISWKKRVRNGEIAIMTHFWKDERFPGCTSITKIGCCNRMKLIKWGEQHGLQAEWIHRSSFPHFDVFGERQRIILQKEGLQNQIERFNI